MNNSFIAQQNVNLSLEEPQDKSEAIQEKQAVLTRIIEAIETINQTSEWKTLKVIIFDDLEKSIERRLKAESEKTELSPSEIYRLQGQLLWARKYADFKKLAEIYKLELTKLKNIHE